MQDDSQLRIGTVGSSLLVGACLLAAAGCTSSSSSSTSSPTSSNASSGSPTPAAEEPSAESEASPSSPAGDKDSGFWPDSARFAVSLTYDDAIASQRTLAAEQLARFNVAGTFFLTGGSSDLAQNRNRWSGLLEAGHELASHTMLHPCDRALDFVAEGDAIQDYDLTRMEAELQQTKNVLGGLGATEPYTFAYPCGETAVGENRDESYIPLVENAFVAARGVVSGLADPMTLELHNIPAFDGAVPADKLLGMLDQAEAAGTWLVVVFHGVGGDYLTVEREDHEALLQDIQRRAGQVWAAPFGTVARYVAENR